MKNSFLSGIISGCLGIITLALMFFSGVEISGLVWSSLIISVILCFLDSGDAGLWSFLAALFAAVLFFYDHQNGVFSHSAFGFVFVLFVFIIFNGVRIVYFRGK